MTCHMCVTEPLTNSFVNVKLNRRRDYKVHFLAASCSKLSHTETGRVSEKVGFQRDTHTHIMGESL